MSELYTSTRDTRVLSTRYAGSGIVGQYTDFLMCRKTTERLGIVTDPLERGILVGEAFHGLLENGHEPERALIMQAEIDENGEFEIDLDSQVNHGIAIGLQAGSSNVCKSVIKAALVELAPVANVELSRIYSHKDYTQKEYDGMKTDHPELAELFPVPKIAIRFSVLGISSVLDYQA